MFDDLALRRAKAMLVRQRAGLPLQEATEALHMLHNNTCTAHLRGPACRHASSRSPRLQAEQAWQCLEACPSCRACV